MSDAPPTFGMTPPDELYELSESLRGVVEQLLRIDAPHAELAPIRAEFDAITARLRQVARQGDQPRVRSDPGAATEIAGTRPYYAGDATRWHYNPFHPRLELEQVGEKSLRTEIRLGLMHEGPPGNVHGGFVAMLFDMVLGHANVMFGLPGLTARLTVRYRRLTPLFEKLVIEADEPEVVGERRCVVKGRILHEGLVTASAEGLFSRPETDFRDHLLSEETLSKEKR